MKKTIFYSLLVFQSLFICLFALQYQLIDKYGTELTIEIDQSKYQDDDFFPEYARLNLEIEKIIGDKWHVQKPKYHEKIYVVLKKAENNIYQVDRVVKNKPTANLDEVILPAKYLYTDVGGYVVDYGKAFEIRTRDHKTNFNFKEAIYATYKIAPWNQAKMIDLTN